jgi:hypothetical protein
MTQIKHIHPYTSINSTTEETTEKLAENITEVIELKTHVTDGPRSVEPSNSCFANLEKPVYGADNPTKNAVQTNANQAVQKATPYPTLDIPENPTRNTVRRPYNVHGVEFTDEQRIEAKHTILEVYGKGINWQTAIEAAGIHRNTLNYWRSIG